MYALLLLDGVQTTSLNIYGLNLVCTPLAPAKPIEFKKSKFAFTNIIGFELAFELKLCCPTNCPNCGTPVATPDLSKI